MSSPAARVLNIAELLEQVLLQLDIRTLLTSALRVNRSWNDFITKSPALQEHLFFQPSEKGHELAVLNPLLSELFLRWFSDNTPEDLPEGRLSGKYQVEAELTDAWRGRFDAFTARDATWRRMLPRQPPIHRVTRCRCDRGPYPKDSLDTLTQRGGAGGKPSESPLEFGPDSNGPAYVHMDADGTKRFYMENDGTSRVYVDADGAIRLYMYEDQEITSDEPLRMETLYDAVVEGSYGWAHDWMFRWDSVRGGGGQAAGIPDKFGDEVITGDLREALNRALRRDGVVLFDRCIYVSLWKPTSRFNTKFKLERRAPRWEGDEEGSKFSVDRMYYDWYRGNYEQREGRPLPPTLYYE